MTATPIFFAILTLKLFIKIKQKTCWRLCSFIIFSILGLLPFSRLGSNNTHNFCGSYSARDNLFQPCMHHFILLMLLSPAPLAAFEASNWAKLSAHEGWEHSSCNIAFIHPNHDCYSEIKTFIYLIGCHEMNISYNAISYNHTNSVAKPISLLLVK